MSRSVESVGMKIAGGQEDDYLESLKSCKIVKVLCSDSKGREQRSGLFSARFL